MVGFVSPEYSVVEADGQVVVCVQIKDPESVSLQASIQLTVTSHGCGLATGEVLFIDHEYSYTEFTFGSGV